MDRKLFLGLLAYIAFQLTATVIEAIAEEAETYMVRSKQLSIALSDKGEITAVSFGAKKAERAVRGFTSLAGCVIKDVKSNKLPDGGMKFTKTLFHEKGKHTFMLVEQFIPTATSIRWEIEIRDVGKPWSTPVTTELKWPASANCRFWTSWMLGNDAWEDPLMARPWVQATWHYGPHFGSGICLPLAGIIDNTNDTGLSLVLSPENDILDMTLTTETDGTLRFERTNHRLGQNRVLRLAMDIVGHEAGWRGGLRWMVNRYQPFFDPPNPNASKMAGCGAYSSSEGPDDWDRLKRMAFRICWAVSNEFPYYGMWLPPVADNETWRTNRELGRSNAGKETISAHYMNERARKMRQAGVYQLSYFNCSEFGTKINIDQPANMDLPDAELWKDQVSFLKRKVADGMWRDKEGNVSRYGWCGSIIMDPAAPDYQAYLLEQARRHIEKIPASAGICIDRMWWASKGRRQPINWGADDAIGWYGGRTGRHFSVSWKDFTSKVGPIMQKADKVVFCSTCMAYRLDLYRHIDGFYDELYPANSPRSRLNGNGLLAIRKPAVMWTGKPGWLQPDPDAFFQRHLYMGAYPTAPFPQNDHSINPDPKAEEYYLDYGPLMDAIRGKKWVLEPHVITVPEACAKANIFEVPGGFVVPVVYAGDAKNVKVVLCSKRFFSEKFAIQALHPGTDKPAAVRTSKEGDSLILDVPVHRGCAMVQMLRQ